MVSLQELTGVLGLALSQTEASVKQAEAQLGSFETQPGYHHALATVFCDASNPQQIRWMAIVCLKNGTNRYWRKNAPGGIVDNEKAAIRDVLLQATTTQGLDQQLGLQLALVIAKIARYDYPGDWAPLVPFLMNALDSPYGYQSSLTLYHVIKSLTTKRMLSDRQVFYILSSQISEPIVACWKATTQAFLANNGDVLALQRSLLSLKSIKLLFVHGSRQDIDKKLASCFEDLFQWMLTMLKCRAHYCQVEPIATVLTKWCVQCSKVLLEVQDQHTVAYIPYVKGSLNLAVQFAFNQDWRHVMFERCLVNAFNLLKACIKEAVYRGPKPPSEDDKDSQEYSSPGGTGSSGPCTSETDLIREFFKDDIVVEFTQRLITEFFPISAAELEKWHEDPEEYATEHGGDLWRYSLRPCTESLFLSLFSEFRPVVQLELMKFIGQIQPLQVEPTFEEAQRRQAIYTAVGLAKYNLYDELDFDRWFVQVLIPELKIKHPNYLIVHRTILWILAEWSDVKCSQNLRPVLYETLAAFMERGQDLVIRLSACLSAKTVVDHFDFDANQFLPFLARYMSATFNLLDDLQECQGKMVVLQTMTFILERMGDTCAPYVRDIVTFLPPLWDQSAEHNLLRVCLLTILARAVDAMSGDSVLLYPLTLKVIAHSVNVEEPQHVFLMEEALDLWRSVLEASPEPNDDLLALAKFIPPILELGSEHLDATCNVLKLYIVLFQKRFLTAYPEVLCRTMVSLFGEMNLTGCTHLLKVVDIAVRVSPADAAQAFYPLLTFAIDEIVAESYTRELTTTSFSIWCRLLLFAEPVAMQLLADRAAAKQSTPELEMKNVMEWWMKKMSMVAVVQTQKLMAITLLRLLVDHWGPVMYEKVCAIALAVCELLNDIMEPNADDTGFTDSLLIPADVQENVNSEISFDHSHHSARMFEIIKRDVAHTIKLSDFVVHQMRSLADKIGAQFAEVLQEIDCETRDMLESYTKTGMFATKDNSS